MTEPVTYEEVHENLSDGTTQTFYVVKLWRGCVLVMTRTELERALRRGRWWRRRQTEKERAIKRRKEEEDML